VGSCTNGAERDHSGARASPNSGGDNLSPFRGRGLVPIDVGDRDGRSRQLIRNKQADIGSGESG
jgi:hypothetical protein